MPIYESKGPRVNVEPTPNRSTKGASRNHHLLVSDDLWKALEQKAIAKSTRDRKQITTPEYARMVLRKHCRRR